MMVVGRDEDGFSVDAALIAELLGVAADAVQDLMRAGEITSICERGEGEHAGEHRLTFFHKGRRARVSVDESGRVFRRTVIDYGERPLPPAPPAADAP